MTQVHNKLRIADDSLTDELGVKLAKGLVKKIENILISDITDMVVELSLELYSELYDLNKKS